MKINKSKTVYEVCIVIVIVLIALVLMRCFLISIEYYTAPPKKYTLGLLAIVKNEDMVIDEWIQHYLWQGVEHIYIIDNGSTDATKQRLEPYIQKQIVSYFLLDEQHQQTKHYNFVYDEVAKNECNWLIVCDADEYMYNRRKGNTLMSFVKYVDAFEVSHIVLSWKMFGSSGHDLQPAEIRKSFVHRKYEIAYNTKCIVNTALTLSLNVHSHEFIANKKGIINPPELALNHYAIMSREYFEKVKMSRGDVSASAIDNFRNWQYFSEYDRNEFHDDELSKLLV